MGISVSHRSPNTTNWRIANAAFLYDQISTSRAIQEIWRAATNQPSGNLADDLSSPTIAAYLRIINSSDSSQEVRRTIEQFTSLSDEISLASQIATRAALKSCMNWENRNRTFVSFLFSEATDYLVSRDISGYVALGKLKNVTDCINFKETIRRGVEERVNSGLTQLTLPQDPTHWRNLVREIVNSLAQRG